MRLRRSSHSPPTEPNDPPPPLAARAIERGRDGRRPARRAPGAVRQLAVHRALVPAQGFAIADLEQALEERTVVKASVMRGTLHLVAARDYPAFSVASSAARIANWRPSASRLASRQPTCTDGYSTSPTSRARSLRWRRSSRRYSPMMPSPERCRRCPTRCISDGGCARLAGPRAAERLLEFVRQGALRRRGCLAR